MGYHYEDQLKDQLVELGTLKDDIDEKKKQYDNMRDQVQKWMEVNELNSFEVTDNKEQDWNIKFEPRKNRRVRDHKLLKEALGDSYNDMINEFESSIFKVGRKARKK
jgi:hypothetical protein